jgi:hypothetical protein
MGKNFRFYMNRNRYLNTFVTEDSTTKKSNCDNITQAYNISYSIAKRARRTPQGARLNGSLASFSFANH